MINNLKSGKAIGPDMLPNEVLNHDGIQNILLSFINKCLLYLHCLGISSQEDFDFYFINHRSARRRTVLFKKH